MLAVCIMGRVGCCECVCGPARKTAIGSRRRLPPLKHLDVFKGAPFKLSKPLLDQVYVRVCSCSFCIYTLCECVCVVVGGGGKHSIIIFLISSQAAVLGLTRGWCGVAAVDVYAVDRVGCCECVRVWAGRGGGGGLSPGGVFPARPPPGVGL